MSAEEKPVVRPDANAGGASSPPQELKRLGKYQIEKKIGAGGMGAVYLARDTELKRVVALKVLPRDKASNPTLVRRFRAEAQAAAQLRHENIVAVFDSGEADGYLYIAMEYVDGQDLFERVARRGVVPVKRSIEIVRQVALALQHAFEQNIVHRDIKPSNLLIRHDGVIKLTDLGLARSIDDTLETNITRAGTTVGTVDYMAPEQARNSKLADIRSDLYSLGCTWYQMLTGSPPFPEGSVTNKLQAHAVKPFPDPRDKNPRVPEGLTAVLQRLTAKKPEDRYQTPADLIDDLEHSTLTQAAISREIFADLSDFDQPATGSDDFEVGDGDGGEDGDDTGGGGGRESQEQETRNEIRATAQDPVRRKPGNVSPDAVRRSPGAGRSQSSDDGTEDEEAEPASGRRRSQAAKSNRSEPAKESTSPTQKSSRSRIDSENPVVDDAEIPTRQQFESRPIHEESADKLPGPSAKSTSKTAKENGKAAKTTDPSSASPKSSGPKPMPPKRQPIDAAADSQKAGFGKDLGKYLGAAAGVILVVGGLGWLLSSLGGSVSLDTNPFAQTPANSTDANGVNNPVPSTRNATNPTTDNLPPENGGDPSTGSTPGVAANVPDLSMKPEIGATGFDVQKIPGWVTRGNDLTGLTTLTVGPAAKSPTHFSTLLEALEAVPPAGAVVRLIGNGPFLLPSIEIKECKRLFITSGNPADFPVISVKPGEGQTTAGLKLNLGTLDLRGVHFTIDREGLTEAVNLIDVVDGQLFVRQCSFTATGPATVPVKAMVVRSTFDFNSVPRIEPLTLVERVVVRGTGLTALRIDRANVDAVVQDMLAATGTAPVIEISGHLTASADVPTPQPRRVLRILRSTLFGQNQIFEVEVDDSGKPPTTAIALCDSLVSSQWNGRNAAQTSAIISAVGWPQIRSTSEGWLSRMTWTSTNSLYLGFEQLVNLGSSFKVTDVATWQRVWNVKPDARQFQKLTFPETELEDLSVLLPQEFDTARLSFRAVKTNDGAQPGCPIGKLSVPDVTSQHRAAALAQRPALPTVAAKPAEPTQVKKVDLKKEDLGVVLNRNDWPSGTLFEVAGGGLCQMSPARINGKSVRIVFQQTDGASLKIQPMQGKATDSGKSTAALISITDGMLELTNAVLEGWPTTKGSTPEWTIQSTNSTVVLNGCRLLGSESEASKQVGLIRWMTAGNGAPGSDVPALVIRDSFLACSGCGVRLEAARGYAILRNSILAIRGDALDLRPVRTGSALLPVVDAEFVTFSATGAAIRFEAAPGTDVVSSPLRLYVERCAFAPPLVFKAGEGARATMLKCAGPVLDQKQLEWWGVSNGIAKQVGHLIHRDGDPDVPSDEKTGISAWRAMWDQGNSLRLLSGDRGVYLASELPNRWKELRPGSFEWHSASPAATWAEGGRPIGANARGVEESSVAKKAGSPPTTKPGIPPIQTKKNFGF
jgi:eukaryotic-like serine/threonine-protein kinase